jgi:hypothetical protein
MSQVLDRARLRGAVERAGDAWIFPYWGEHADRHLGTLHEKLGEFIDAYEKKFGERPDPMGLLDANPLKWRAFFQIDTLTLSVEMKILVWRLLLGCEITRVEFGYQLGHPHGLSISLRSPYGVDEGPYIGKEPADFRVFRYIGVTHANDQLVLEGYYATKPWLTG